MFAVKIENERQTLPNENRKYIHNQFAKSLTSFHTKKNNSKNSTHHNSTKKNGPLNLDKPSKTKRVFLSR